MRRPKPPGLRSWRRGLSTGVVAMLLAAAATGVASATENGDLPAGLRARATVDRDADGIAHIAARNEHDLLFLQGWVHASDRLFQMDVTRRQASGTLAELFGQAVLPDDVEARTIGLRRAAERSLAVQSPVITDALTAYADGVNAWVADHKLPDQYAALQLARFQPWTVLDSLAVGKALSFELSFDLDIDPTVTARLRCGRTTCHTHLT